MATLISEFDDPPGAAKRPEEPPAVDLAAAATGDVESLRRAFEAQLAAQEQRHAAELRAAALGDAKVPLLGATKRLLAEADAMRASRTRGADDGSDDEDVFAGPTTDESGPPADVARAIAAARALPEHPAPRRVRRRPVPGGARVGGAGLGPRARGLSTRFARGRTGEYKSGTASTRGGVLERARARNRGRVAPAT